MTLAQIFSVRGKAALVTGAATGLGLAMAEALAENGADLTCFDRNAEGLGLAADRLRAMGGRVIAVAGDVTDADAVADAVAQTVARFGKLDIAIANAGISDPAPALLHEADPANWRKVVEVNLNGVFHTDRAALAAMVGQGAGKIINVASMWGLAGSSGVFARPAYSATKGAVVNLTRELGLEYARAGIQINALCPGFFRTAGRPKDEATARLFRDFTPMGRIADPAEIKGSVLYLASAASDFVTGTALVIDGGCLAK